MNVPFTGVFSSDRFPAFTCSTAALEYYDLALIRSLNIEFEGHIELTYFCLDLVTGSTIHGVLDISLNVGCARSEKVYITSGMFATSHLNESTYERNLLLTAPSYTFSSLQTLLYE